MAFNPFKAFRKHQKVMMAGLVLVAMLSFVLCTGLSGGGDFAAWLGQQLGFERPGRQSQEVATLYGREVDAAQLDTVRGNREIANVFMMLATFTAIDRRADAFLEQHPEMKKQAPEKATAGDLRMFWRSAMVGQFRDPETLRLLDRAQPLFHQPWFREGDLQTPDLDRQLYINSMQVVQQAFQQGDVLVLRNAPQIVYFEGGRSAEALLDFMIWLHQADRLGINLNDEAVKEEVSRLTNNKFRDEDARQVLKMMQGQIKGLTPTRLQSALRDEFRVRLARSALEGLEPGTKAQMPVAVTPYEFWDFFKENRTELQVSLLPVPVQDFVSQVKEQPTDKELNDLFVRYRAQEPQPDSETPGFRQPRRIQVQWVSTRPESPYYRQIARIESAMLRAMPQTWDLYMFLQYQDFRRGFDLGVSPFAPSLTNPQFSLYFYRDLNRPESVAALVGQFVGTTLTPTPASVPALSALSGYQYAAVTRDLKNPEVQAALREEARRRAVVGATLLLAGADTYPLALPALWRTITEERQYLPYPVVRKYLVQKVQEELARNRALQNLLSIQKNVLEKAKKPDTRKEIPQDLEKAAKEQHITVGVMAEPRNHFELPKDPALQKMKESFLGARQQTRLEDQRFADYLLNRTPLPGIEASARGLYAPSIVPMEPREWTAAAEPILFWTIKDEPAYTPPSMQKAREQVEAAWKLQKARELAKKDADQLAERVQKLKGDMPKILDLENELKRKLIYLGRVSKLKAAPPPAFSPFPTPQRTGYTPYQVSEDHVAYPGPEFVNQLLTLKDKDLGATLVLNDQPKSTYYVAVLLKKHSPTESDFFAAYKEESSAPAGTPGLFARLELEKQKKYRTGFMEQLRAQAGLKIPDEFRRGFDREGTASE